MHTHYVFSGGGGGAFYPERPTLAFFRNHVEREEGGFCLSLSPAGVCVYWRGALAWYTE